MKAKAKGGTRYDRTSYARMPDWSGAWAKRDGANFDNTVLPVARGFGPRMSKAILENCQSFPCPGYITADIKPEYVLRLRQKLTAVVHGIEWDPMTDCLPSSFPRNMLGPVTGRYFMPTPAMTLMYFEEDMGNRTIFTDGRGHLPEDEAYPLWAGDSIGFWDGDTLVVHTLYVRGGQLGRALPDFSQQASVVERIRMVDGDTIENQMTLFDPLVLNKPWVGVQRYVRVTDPHARVDLHSCAESNNTYQRADGSTGGLLPGETLMLPRTYMDPETVQYIGVNRAIASGAKIMAEEAQKRAGAAK
jgi:hypothetical protein